MLVREVVARYLGEAGTIRVDADPTLLTDIARAGPVADLEGGADPAPGDVVLLSVDPSAGDLADRLGRVTARGVTVVLLLPVAVGDLPVGRLAQAACVARLAFVEIAPIEPGWSLRTVVVCRPSSRAVPVRPFLGDDSAVDDDIDLDSQGLRIAWEWGLGDARARAVEEAESTAVTRIGELERELAEVRRDLGQEIATARGDLDAARAVAERSELRAAAESKRRSSLQQSPTFLVGRAIVTARRHPLRGSRQLLGAIRRSVGR